MSGDLHCHSTKSDGSMKPCEIVKLASRLGLETLAITDHDTMAGVGEALECAKEAGVEVIPGIELSTYDYTNKRKLHLLCYYPKTTKPIEEICKKTLSDRSNATLKMLEKVKEKYPIDLEVLKHYKGDSEAFYKQHIIRALYDMGYTLTVFGDLYRELFSAKTGWAYVPFTMIDSHDALRAVKETGGAAVLAHPGVYGNFDIIEDLVSMGLDGIEVHHPRMSDEDCKRAYDAAERFNLIKTGGSDFHGMNSSVVCPLGKRLAESRDISILRERFSK